LAFPQRAGRRSTAPTRRRQAERSNRHFDEPIVTCFVSVAGDDTNDGRTRRTAFATLQKAADVVQVSQTVLVTNFAG
jgi:hypothetical protein